MAEEVEMDQQVYDELIAAGKSERIARAKAKAAAVKAKKVEAGETIGPRQAAAPAAAAAAAPAAAAAGAAPAAGGGAGGVATRERTAASPGGLTPEERQRRVAAALAQRGDGAATRTNGRNGDTKFAGQDHTHRLLAMVPPDGIQQIKGKQEDKVYTWPHLIASEFVCILAWTVGVMIFSAIVAAPLRDLANPSLTPNPSKAPWYFLGLQELLRYFHPMVAGVTIPTVGILLGMALPYFDRNPSIKPENRKFAFVGFTFFLIFAAVLAMSGSFFRGPGFEWVWPWVDNLYFEL